MNKKKIVSSEMMNEKNNQDFNNQKPNANDPGFKEPIKDPHESDTTNNGMNTLDKTNIATKNGLVDTIIEKENFFIECARRSSTY